MPLKSFAKRKKKGGQDRVRNGSSWPRTVNIVFHVRSSAHGAPLRTYTHGGFREEASGVRYRVGMFRSFGTRTQRSDSTGTGTKTAGFRGVSSGALCSRVLSCHAICCSYVMIVASVYQLSVLSVTMLAMPLWPLRETFPSSSLSRSFRLLHSSSSHHRRVDIVRQRSRFAR